MSDDVLPWRNGADAPKDGTYIAGLRTLRWKAYKPASEQYRLGLKGRWQEATEFGGWDNCAAPEYWLPHPQPREASL